MKQMLALWLSVMVIVWSVILPAIAVVLFLLLVNASAPLSLVLFVTFGCPLIITCAIFSHKLADRIADWGDNHAR